MVARLISIATGLVTIWCVYQASRRLFPKDKSAALLSAYFLATSILAIAVSSSARHWPFAALLAMLGFALLVNSRREFARRYLWTAAIAGIGMGIKYPHGGFMRASVFLPCLRLCHFSFFHTVCLAWVEKCGRMRLPCGDLPGLQWFFLVR
ncbi:MAG: glycosyltransferase family 39 protein [Candidatus Sungbacteria bacterium]|nr:glycosyltransferase family 39 protein [Candidatus Sungbacteria bacterium]